MTNSERISEGLREAVASFNAPSGGGAQADPAADFPAMGIEPGGEVSRDLDRQRLEGELAAERERNADLEAENRRLRQAAAAGIADAERRANDYAAKTHNGRLPSILGF